MKIAICGYGRMGRLIEAVAKECRHDITAVIDPVSQDAAVTARVISKESLNAADVVIDFSIPATAVANMRDYASCGVSVVMGTTGWYDQMEAVRTIVESSGIGCIWSGNFSLGVNILFAIVEQAAEIMNRFPEYDCMVHEYHHKNKADSPSGTASMIGAILLNGLDRKDTLVTEMLRRPIGEHELHVSSTRGGEVPGTHIITFDSAVDSIEITHRARGREGFAAGAVKAAEWIEDRSGMFAIEDMMTSMIRGE